MTARFDPTRISGKDKQLPAVDTHVSLELFESDGLWMISRAVVNWCHFFVDHCHFSRLVGHLAPVGL